MPFCTQCANEIPEGGRFCAACGAPVAAPAAPKASAPPPPIGETMAPPTPPPSSSGFHGRFDPGTRLGTRYRIVALLGRGGMGEVYRADDLELGQSVALKFLPPSVATNPEELARFRGEVRVARQIAHPNVCRVYDIGDADGHVFLSMEYIDGEDLESVLRRMGRPTPDKAVEIARQICLGLAAAHEAGMLHRDLKPANVMIDGRGRARITDFGLAGLAVELAKSGEIAGTPAYMAPEQLTRGLTSVRSDVYALGLVLYELFTGKRVYDTANANELRRLHESGTIRTPSEITRDIDPAVERAILHCLERDPDARPSSAYAVLGALPGGDPLAAAIAAGETPSPELVANAGDRGGLAPPIAFLLLALAGAAIATWAGTIGPELRVATQPTQVLSVRAADLLAKTGTYAKLPTHSAEGFDENQAYLAHLRKDKAEREAKHTAIYYWRRFSPVLLESPFIHQEVPDVRSPRLLGAGEAAVLFDPAGRLIGFRSVPPDSAPAWNGGRADWQVLIAAAGLDSSALRPTALARAVPSTCDTAIAWRALAPGVAEDTVTVQAGASRGRLTYFTMIHDWGSSADPIENPPKDPTSGPIEWLNFLVFSAVPLAASVYFGFRNVALGRGDWRAATRIAAFVFVMNVCEGLFATHLGEVGLLGAGADVVNGRALGHSLMHAVGMWFAYVALEPYVRRLWPRMLVGWTRLVSGRVRDPLVGRDLLLGGAVGALLVAVATLGQVAAVRFAGSRIPTLLNSDILQSLGSLPNTAVGLAYAGSICVLQVLETLVVVLVLRLVLRRTDLALVATLLLLGASSLPGASADAGWVVAAVNLLVYFAVVLVLMRFGLLAAVVATYFSLVMSYGVGTFDLSAWYADRALVPLAFLGAVLLYGAFTALSGKSILGDPLREAAGR